MKRLFSSVVFAAAAFALGGCNNSGESLDFERMVNQRHYEYYEETEFFPDRRAMRTPPEGAVPADRPVLAPRVATGLEEDGSFVAAIPIPLSRASLETGKHRFDVFCTPCHGSLGDGQSVVASKMSLRKPPSLVAAPVAGYPAGRVYRAIVEGYGLMPSYGTSLSAEERWFVVAYVRALGLRSAGIPLSALPNEARARAREELQ